MADESRVTVRLRLIGAAAMSREARRASGSLGGIGRAGKRAHVIQSAVGKSSRGAASGLRRAAGAAVATSAAYLGIHGAKTAITTTEELAKTTSGLHKMFGLSIPQASRFAAVLKARGVDAKSTTMAFSSLSKNIVSARKGTGSAVDNFKALGLSQRDVAKDGLDFNAIIFRVADALHGNQRDFRAAAAARSLFGRGFQTMVPLLRQGSAGLQETLSAADKYGVTLNSKTIGPVMELVKSQRELKLAGLGVQVQLTRLLVPGLLKLETAAERVLTVFNRKDLTLDQKIKKAGQIVGPLVASIGQHSTQISKAITTVVAAAAPAIAHSAGLLGVAFVKGLWNSITSDKTGLFTKAILVAFIAKKLGLFGLIGAMAGGAFRRRFGSPIPTPGRGPGGGVGGRGGRGGPKPKGGGPGILPLIGKGAKTAGKVALRALPIVGTIDFARSMVTNRMPFTGQKLAPPIVGPQGAEMTAWQRLFGVFSARPSKAAARQATNVSKQFGTTARASRGITSAFGKVNRPASQTAVQFGRTRGAAGVAAARFGAIPALKSPLTGLARTARTAAKKLEEIPGVGALVPVKDPGPTPTTPSKRRPKAKGKDPAGGPTGRGARFMVPHVTVNNTVDAKGLHTAVYHHERLIGEAR